MQRSLVLKAAPAPGVARSARRVSSNVLRPAKRFLVARAAQEGVETAQADGELVPMADSLIERAKLVVETNFVDEAFAETFVPELEAELAALRTRADQAEASASQLEESLKDAKDKFVRLTADFENFRKRTAAEKEAMKATVRGDTVAELLPLVDNFELAKKQLKLETEGEIRVDNAYQGLYKQLVELFRGLGLEATPGVGSPFDPNLHDGIMRELDNTVPDGTVLEEFRKGFMIGDKLVRPAMVKVSYQDGPGPAASSDAGGEGGAESGGDAPAEGGNAAASQ